MVKNILNRKKRAQSIFEYAVLVTIIVAAFMFMNKYVFRSVNARLKQIQEEVSTSNAHEIEYDGRQR